MATSTDARRELAKFAKSDTNWRLAGLYLAHPDVPSGYSEQEVAKAWPTHKSDYRMLGAVDRDSVSAPDKQYALDSEGETFRQLSSAANESDFDDGPFGQKVIHSDRAIKRTLAFEDSIANLDTLFRQEIRETVLEGARKQQIARDASNVINVDRSRGDHPRGPDDQFAPKVAEGAAIPDDAGEHDTVTWDTEKHGQGMRATEELLNQALVDVIARNMEFLGRSCENAINRVWLNELVDNASVTVDASGEDNRGWAAINEAIHQVELNDFMPDTAVTHPTFTKTLFDTAENNAVIPRANEFGDDEGIRDRVAFPLLGIDGFRGSNGVYDGANTWDYSAADETGAVVYQRNVTNLYMFRDIEMKEYDDPVRDLEGVNARVDIDCTLGQPDAAAKIDYSVT
jgi:hypothetical protein